MPDRIDENSSYGDIGSELKEAGWMLTGVSIADSAVTLSYERVVEEEIVDSIVSTHESGSMARYAAVRRMQASKSE